VRFATSGESAFNSNGSRFIRRGETANVSRISGECKSRDFRSTRRGDASGSKSVSARKHLEIHSIAFDGYSLESREKARGSSRNERTVSGNTAPSKYATFHSRVPATSRRRDAAPRVGSRSASRLRRFNFRKIKRDGLAFISRHLLRSYAGRFALARAR